MFSGFRSQWITPASFSRASPHKILKQKFKIIDYEISKLEKGQSRKAIHQIVVPA